MPEPHPSHRWGAMFGGAVVTVNGVPRRTPSVCVICLVQDDHPEALRECDRAEPCSICGSTACRYPASQSCFAAAEGTSGDGR